MAKYTTSILKKIQSVSDLFSNTSINNWKPLFEVNFSKNSRTIRLFASDFYEVLVDLAFGLINYHLIEF